MIAAMATRGGNATLHSTAGTDNHGFPCEAKLSGITRTTLETDGERIAVRRREGASPGLFWLGGYRSDMTGTKAEALDRFGAERGLAVTRHDYSGHGESSGDYVDGTISRWLAQSLAVLHGFTAGPQILVGSSMGAWIALRMVEELTRAGETGRIAGLVLLAPAPDFTVELIEPGLDNAGRAALEEKGFIEEPSEYSPEPNIYTRALIEDGRRNRVLDAPIHTHCPVHILHGRADPDVPYSLAIRLAEHLPADDVTLTLVPDGDHRLSRPQDIAQILAAVAAQVEATRQR